jgi:hypothetical protein
MLGGNKQHYYIGLAVFLVFASFTVFLSRRDEHVVYDKVAKVPYKCPSTADGWVPLFLCDFSKV